MRSSHRKTLVGAVVAAVAIIVSASDAFAIRNRYTNRQAEGFGAYFFGDYDRPYPGDVYGYDGYDEPGYAPYGVERPFRPYRGRRRDYRYYD